MPPFGRHCSNGRYLLQRAAAAWLGPSRPLRGRLGFGETKHCQLLFRGVGKSMRVGAILGVVQTPQERDWLVAVAAAQFRFPGETSYPTTSVGSRRRDCYAANNWVFLSCSIDMGTQVRGLPYNFQIGREIF